MTTRGGIAFGLFALLLLAGLATGISEIFAAAFMAGFLLAFALASSIAGVFVLRIRQSVGSTAMVRGNDTEAAAAFSGFPILPVVVYVTMDSPDGMSRRYASFLWGNRRPELRQPLSCPHRGLWPAGISRLRCGDLFGFFRLPFPRARRPEAQPPLVIYPELYVIPGQPPVPPPSLEYSEKNPVTADQGDSFSDTRLYRSGDPLKRIHWKLSIRTRELHTRQYEMSVDQTVLILLDNSRWEKDGEQEETALGYADMASECAAALVYYYLGSGHAVRLLWEDGGIDVLSREDFEEAYTLLASLEFRAERPLADWMPEALGDLGRICALYGITREPQPEILDCLIGVPSPRRPAVLICSASEELAADGEAVAEGLRVLPVSAPRDILERLGGWQ